MPGDESIVVSKLKALADHKFKMTETMAFLKVVNSLANEKILDWSKLKALADNKIKVLEKLKIILGRKENIVRKGENAVYQHFLLFPQCFQKTSLLGLLKVGIV